MSNTIQITITHHETKVSDDGQHRVIVTDAHKKKYTHFINEEDGDWGKMLRTGNTVWVNHVEKASEYKGKPITYHNIYKPDLDQIPATPPQAAPAAAMPDTIPEPPDWLNDQPTPPEQAQETPVKHKTDKDIEIRWQVSMKCASWIVAGLIDLKKHGEPEIMNYLTRYINFFNTFQPGMTFETIPISTAQCIELHNRLVHYGISKLFYHEVLEKILDKKVIKTTDLTYSEAATCIKEFDVAFDALMVSESTDHIDAQKLE